MATTTPNPKVPVAQRGPNTGPTKASGGGTSPHGVPTENANKKLSRKHPSDILDASQDAKKVNTYTPHS